MSKHFYKILVVFIFTYGLCSCNPNNSQESGKEISLKDTSADVSITVPDDSIIISETKTTATEEYFKSVSDIHKKNRKKPSLFVIRNNRDTVIKCKEGTLITIPANSFERAKDQSPMDGTVKLAITEYYSVSDMLLANLTTASGSAMIESGGMFSITARAKDNNDSLSLRKGKDITIALPISELKNMDGMQVFNGVHDSSGINWEPRKGSVDFAQQWSPSRPFSIENRFKNFNIFPDDIPKKTPVLAANSKQTFTVETTLPLREVIQNSSNTNFVRGAFGYVDTTGSLHGYLTGNKKNRFQFETNYTQTISENMPVNVAVSFKVKISTKNAINIIYYDKLFKMGKGNPDSLVAVIVTLVPAIKKINYEKIEVAYDNTVRISAYQKVLKEIVRCQKAYEKHVKLLEANPLSNIKTAQEYLLLNTQQLGWINCDRFNYATKKTDYLVKLTEKTHVLIVFNNIKSILGCDGRGIFHNVPVGSKITIVALKTDNGKIALAMHETVIGEKPFENLEFKPITLNEYKLQLEKLNSI